MRDYYSFTGPFAEKVAEGLLTTPQAIAGQVRGYAEAGCDELVLLPAVADPDQVQRLADVVAAYFVPAVLAVAVLTFLAWAVAGPEPRLACPVTGDLALPTTVPDVAWRGGLDLNPLDVRDKDQMAWLEILVWPEHDDRRDRLRHAIEIARADPPHLERGDILADLPLLVADASRHGEVVVFHSAVVAYLPAEDRARFDTMMRRLVSDGACRWVSNEGLNVVPSVLDGAPEPPDRTTFALAVDGRAVAWSHPHGRSMRWFG
jgi:hypothetical protein